MATDTTSSSCGRSRTSHSVPPRGARHGLRAERDKMRIRELDGAAADEFRAMVAEREKREASDLATHARAVHPDNSQGEGAWLDLLQDLRS